MHSVGLLFFNGAIVQTFLLLIGFDEGEVYLYSSLSQAAQVVVMLLMVFLSDRIEKKRLLCALSNFLMIIPIGIFCWGAACPEIMSDWYVALLFTVSVITHGGIGMYNVMTYCLPYKLIDISEYGKFTGISGALGGSITFALSSLHTVFVSNFDYLQCTVWFFMLAIASVTLSGIMLLWMKEIPAERSAHEGKTVGFVEAFRNKDTYALLLPNFTRGLATGIFNVVAVIAISSGVADAAGATYINIVSCLASFLSSLAFALVCNKMRMENIMIIATLATSLSLPFVISWGFAAFLLLLFVSLFFLRVVDAAIPTALVRIIPEEQIGAYNSVRMLVFTGSQAVATAIIMPLVGVVGYTGVLVFASAMQLFCGIGHYLVIHSHATAFGIGSHRKINR
jgi:Na+/melibiose symporter-like transporter